MKRRMVYRQDELDDAEVLPREGEENLSHLVRMLLKSRQEGETRDRPSEHPSRECGDDVEETSNHL